jgi:hypothetical protein
MLMVDFDSIPYLHHPPPDGFARLGVESRKRLNPSEMEMKEAEG